ncbi:MAG: dephospho-CoA kinase [Anaerolineales bacterium]|jgi:dephospho-CoA kinase
MGGWAGKYVIGLTGNIATGKSVIRRMLEHLGAYGIDADALSHRAMARGAPGYAPIVKLFGTYILDEDGQIDRARLGRLVFADPQALQALEQILHPLVRQAVDLLVRRAPQKVIVIEAIKLLEGDLRQVCDAIWVTHSNPIAQLSRLKQKRRMSDADARQRIDAQSSQQEKVAAADVVIENSGSIEAAWRQVNDAWQQTVPMGAEPQPAAVPAAAGELHALKGGPAQAEEIAAFIQAATDGHRQLDRMDVMEAFGEKAFLLLIRDDQLVGLTGWQVENLVARVDDFYVDGRVSLDEAARILLNEIEQASRELQCEAALLFLPAHLARAEAVWAQLGYEKRTINSLGVRAWQDAARESMPEGTELFFHQLRKDRVLRPV